MSGEGVKAVENERRNRVNDVGQKKGESRPRQYRRWSHAVGVRSRDSVRCPASSGAETSRAPRPSLPATPVALLPGPSPATCGRAFCYSTAWWAVGYGLALVFGFARAGSKH